MKVFLYFVGKPKDPHANALAADYIKRADRYSSAQMTELKPGRNDFWTKHPTATKILLDPAGQSLDSDRFAKLFANAEMLGHDLVFVIGGHDGLPAGWAARADRLLSLSPLTFPHELARVLLAEQIYRAFATLRGHPYPR